MTTLNDIAAALLAVTGFMDDTSKDKITRQINPTLNISCTFIAASAEPVGVVLPMNVVWLCMDVNSAFYRKFLARKSKTPAGGFQNTWEEVKNLTHSGHLSIMTRLISVVETKFQMRPLTPTVSLV